MRGGKYVQSAQAAAERVMTLLDTQPDIVDSPEVVAQFGDNFHPKRENWPELHGDIDFEHVDFKYQDGERVLTDFNLHVKAGETIALVPGAVINISYESETGNIWIVMPDAAAGWSRVQQQTAATDGKTAQITYEQIAAVCGDDASTWGARMQFESDGAWKVYAVTVGQSK